MKENQALLWVSITLLFLLFVPAYRIHTSFLLPEEISYYPLRIAEQYLSGTLEDSFYDTKMPLTPFHLLLAGFMYFFSGYAPFLLSFMLFVGSYFLFYLLLKEEGVPVKLLTTTMILLATSPISIFASVSLVQEQFSIFLIIIGFFVFFRNKWWSIPLFAITIWQSVFNLVVILVLLGYLYHEGNHFSKYIPLSLIALAVFIHPLRLDPFPETGYLSIVTDLGAIIGIGIFYLLLLMVGLHQLWTEKYANMGKYAIFFLGISSWLFLGSSVAFYLNFYLAYLAAKGLLSLFDGTWESAQIKQLTFFVMICGLLFSSLSYANRLSTALPDTAIQEGALWLSQNTLLESIILASPSRGFWLEYFGKRKAFATPLNSKESDVNSIFYSRDIAKTRELLKSNKITYIWIDKNMKQSVWTKDDEGIQFLFNNKEMFRNVYNEKGVEIWKVY